MTRMCRSSQARSWRSRQLVWATLRHARIVTDPKILARLNAEVESRKRPVFLASRPIARNP